MREVLFGGGAVTGLLVEGIASAPPAAGPLDAMPDALDALDETFLTADRRPPTADRRPPTADRRPP
ncbi:hypothetical protein [Streptomyces sp. NPDC007100]|uniref:hypothetical protein n=1 Tax=Streptomyces sp. NPDC007100 TaxID=3155602 RepID=UPI0033C492AD